MALILVVMVLFPSPFALASGPQGDRPVRHVVLPAGHAPGKALADKQGDVGGLTIVAASVTDGDADEKSKDIAVALRESLRLVTSYHVIDSGLTAEVLGYYDTEETIPQVARLAEEALAQAKENYFAFRYEESETAVRQAISLLSPETTDLRVTRPLLVDAYITHAVILKSKGNVKAAREAIALALQINPRLDIRAEEYPPSLVSIFEEERALLTGVPGGSLSVDTRPSVAEVYLNGIMQGVTPLTLKGIPGGAYEVEIRTNKYDPIRRTAQVVAGGHVKINEHLQWTKDGAITRNRAAADAAAEVKEGLRIADLMKADKAILIDVDSADGAETISARMIDRRLGAGLSPLILQDIHEEDRAGGLAELALRLADQAKVDIAKDPSRSIDPKGIATPVLLAKRKKPLHRNPIFWGVIGALAAGAVGGGVAAAMAGGSGSVGSVKVEFR